MCVLYFCYRGQIKLNGGDTLLVVAVKVLLAEHFGPDIYDPSLVVVVVFFFNY